MSNTTSCGSESSGGGGAAGVSPSAARVALLRIDQALRRLDQDAQSGGPGSAALKSGLEARLLAAEHTVLARQAVEVMEADIEAREMKLDPELPRLLEGLSDLPYLAEIAAAVREAEGGTAPGSNTYLLSSPGLGPAQSTPAVCKFGADCCKLNCGEEALKSLGLELGLSAVGGIADVTGWAGADGLTAVQCVRSIDGLKECISATSCHAADLAAFGLDCGVGYGGVLAKTLGFAVATPIKIIAFAASVTVSVVKANDVTYAECASYQETSCCPGKLRCGVECCASAQACKWGRCVNPSAQVCPDGEAKCGGYCCPVKWVCPDKDCVGPSMCPNGTLTCYGQCCAPTESCMVSDDVAGCEACATVTCGTVCCPAGHFCNLVGQCAKVPDGGCGVLCAGGCCPPGMTCVGGACQGTPSACGDGKCASPQESAATCPKDCGSACGDGTCEPWETSLGCPKDCTPKCGDGTCAPSELTTCLADCGFCGDLKCSASESASTCPKDCVDAGTPGACGDPDFPIDCSSICCPKDRPICGAGVCCAANEQPCAAGCCPSGGTCPPSTPEDCAVCCPGDSCCPSDLYCCGDCDSGC
ncbi:MAG: hypothetical protein KF718_00385 [Polyangiaceae bacterium]|nr:hypothetical protein [Polyangiaceae bacterium]